MKKYTKIRGSFLFLMITVMLLSLVPAAFAAGSSSYCPKAPVNDRGVRGDHSYGSWKTTKKSTCKTEGTRTRKCEYCGDKQTKKIAKNDHSWGEWTIIQKPTARAAGLREHTCNICSTAQRDTLYPTGTLKRGDRGDRVKLLQTALNERGFNCGKPDGVFGRNTEQAVMDFENLIRMDPDGIVWPVISWSLYVPQPEEPVSGLVLSIDAPDEDDVAPVFRNEELVFGWTLTNTTDEAITEWTVTTEAWDGSDVFMGGFERGMDISGLRPYNEDRYFDEYHHCETIEPGASISGSWKDVVTQDDFNHADSDGDYNSLYVHYLFTASGLTEGGTHAASNEVFVDYRCSDSIMADEYPHDEDADHYEYPEYQRADGSEWAAFEIWEASTPANGEYYVEGEMVSIGYRLTNTQPEGSGRVLKNILLKSKWDHRYPHEIVHFSRVDAGSSVETVFEFPMGKDAVKSGSFKYGASAVFRGYDPAVTLEQDEFTQRYLNEWFEMECGVMLFTAPKNN